MTYPYYVLRHLDCNAEEPIAAVYGSQLEFLMRRVKRRLQLGVLQHKAEDYKILLDGCEAARRVLDEVPDIIERWHEELDPDEAARDLN